MSNNVDMIEQITEWLRLLANYQGSDARDQVAFHEYYESAGFAKDKIKALGADAIDGLAENLKHTNPKIRKYAIRLLAHIDDERVLPYLTEHAIYEPDPELQSMVQRQIDRINGQDDKSRSRRPARPKADNKASPKKRLLWWRKKQLDQDILNDIVKTIQWVDGIKSSQIYNDEIGVLIGKAKKNPDEALAACRRTNTRTAKYVEREVRRHIDSLES